MVAAIATNVEQLYAVLEFKKLKIMNITEVDLLTMIFRYKDEHGLTAKDINTEELSTFARWLLSQNSVKLPVSGSLLLPTEADASAYAIGAFGYEADADDKERGFMSGYQWTVDWIYSKLGGNDR